MYTYVAKINAFPIHPSILFTPCRDPEVYFELGKTTFRSFIRSLGWCRGQEMLPRKGLGLDHGEPRKCPAVARKVPPAERGVRCVWDLEG